jgi:hypothetical protein
MRRALCRHISGPAFLGLSVFFLIGLIASLLASPLGFSNTFQLHIPHAQAQEGGVDVDEGETLFTNPKIRDRTVTATVPDNAPPSTPILIAPANNSLITDSTPTFVWVAATDDIEISKYVLHIDGNVYFDNLPLNDITNSQYTLTYDSETNQYSLTPASGLADGVHTWKIEVCDVGNQTSHCTDSVTWTFTIDSTPPSFVINEFGTETVTISAQDITTVPASPLVLTENEPLIVANGEANSSVQVTLVIPDEPTQNFTVSIDSDGNWELQLGILPRGVVMTMDFLITDAAGNISVLNGVEFMIEQDVIVFPPVSPSPTPSAPVGTPDPSATPDPGATPGATPEVPPGTPAPSPLIVIPITPPRETIFRGLQRFIDSLPEPVQEVLESFEPLVEELAPISALLVAGAIPIISTIAVATQFGGSLSPTLLLKILQALGLIPVGKPQGMVFNSETDEGIPFAILTFRNREAEDDLSIVETVVTDTDGIYKGINLPEGVYQIEVRQQDYRFPTRYKRPLHLTMADYYRGEIFNLEGKQEPLFLIPMDPLVATNDPRWVIRARVMFARWARQSSVILYPLAFLSAVLAILYPTFWNYLVFGLYVLLIIRRVIVWFRSPLITGQVVDEKGQPLSRVIVRLTTIHENALAAVLLTNSNGEFAYYGASGIYQLSLQKRDYVWMTDELVPLSFYEVDARTKREHVVANLTPISEVLKDFKM